MAKKVFEKKESKTELRAIDGGKPGRARPSRIRNPFDLLDPAVADIVRADAEAFIAEYRAEHGSAEE